jgi:phosphatidylglycerol lysyltransferase
MRAVERVKASTMKKTSRASLLGRLVSVAALLPALLLGIDGWLDALSVTPSIVATLAAVLPLDPRSPSLAVLVTGALAAFLLAIGLWRGKRFAWWLALVVLTAGAVQQGVAMHHPFGALVALACVALLVLDRGRYVVASPPKARRTVVALVGIGLAAPLLLVVGGFRPLDVASGWESWLALGDPIRAIGTTDPSVMLSLMALARVPLVLALLLILKPAPEPHMTQETARRAADVARRYGHGALLPFQLAPDKLLFSDAAYDAVIVYGRSGRVACLLGDPIGPTAQAWHLFDAFLNACRERDWVPAVYQSSSRARGPLLERGFRCYCIGHEALLPLASFDLVGRSRANLRHTIARARRGGVQVQWYPEGLEAEEARRRWPELEALDRAWRRGSGPQMGFTLGGFCRSILEDRPIAIAEGKDGRAIAFVTFLPTGADDGWVVDLMRRQPGSVPGALEWCIAEAATHLRRAGDRMLSLGLAPLAAIGGRHTPLPERVLAAFAWAVRPLYDVKGLARFKEKFDVSWEAKYLAVRHPADLGSVGIGLLALHLRRH